MAKEKQARPIKEKYLNALIKLRGRLTKEGAVEDAVLVREEIEILTQGKERQLEKESRSDLGRLRGIYERELATLEASLDKKYEVALGKLQRSFQNEKKLEAVLAVKDSP